MTRPRDGAPMSILRRRSWRDFAREEFRKTRSPEEAAQLLRLADDYAALLESVHAHKDLLVSYNISTGESSCA